MLPKAKLVDPQIGTARYVLQRDADDAHYQAEHQRVLDTLFTEANLNEFGYYQVSKNMILSLKSVQSPEGV